MNAKTRNLLYLFSLTPATVCIIGNLLGNWFTLSNIVFSLLILGGVEWLSKPLCSNEHSANNDPLPKAILLLHIPFQLLSIGTLYYGIGSGNIQGKFMIYAAISTGLNSGSSAIVAAHEFIHKKAAWQQFLGKLLLFTAGNLYFFIEHLRVHHKWVGTKKDHASALKGESLYRFFIRSSTGQFNGAWKLEKERLSAKNKSAFAIGNYVLNQLLLQLFWGTMLYYLFGIAVVFAWILQCLIANFLLEYVNYIEHYGLSRSENTRVNEMHSWDSDLFVSRFVLVDLSRHADHHFYASKPYHTLKNYQNSPKLPTGYAGLFFIAAIPPLWFKIMDKRIAKF